MFVLLLVAMADSPYQGTTTPASRKSGTVGRLTFPEVFLKSAQLVSVWTYQQWMYQLFNT